MGNHTGLFSTLLIFLGALSLTASSCKHRQPPIPSEESAGDTLTLPKDFTVFYKTFHADTQYQLEHIAFPLESTTIDSTGTPVTIEWTAQKWRHHKMITPDDYWQVDFTMPTDNIVREIIYTRMGGYYIERRYVRNRDDWYLFYYSDVQQLPARKTDAEEEGHEE